MKYHLIKKVFKGLIRRFLGTQILKVHYLGKRIVPQDTDWGSLVKPLEYNDFLLGDKEEFTPAKLEVIRRRFEDKSYKAYGIIENNILIYSCWISLVTLGLPTVLDEPLQLSEEQGYLEDDYCSVHARGRGIHTKMIAYRLYELYRIGRKVCITTVMDGNIAAIKANLKNGMKDLGVFYCGRIFWRPFCTLSPRKKIEFDSKL